MCLCVKKCVRMHLGVGTWACVCDTWKLVARVWWVSWAPWPCFAIKFVCHGWRMQIWFYLETLKHRNINYLCITLTIICVLYRKKCDGEIIWQAQCQWAWFTWDNESRGKERGRERDRKVREEKERQGVIV